MSNDTDFLARWSRRKHDAATDKVKQSKPDNATGGIASGTFTDSVAPSEDRLPFDSTSLPKIESLGAGSDIRAFLEAGVPDDLTRAALRRVWSLDLTIRDFVGLSENSWDFNAPDAMSGFGPIDEEDVGRLLKRVLGEPEATVAAAHPPLMAPWADDSQKPVGESDPAERQATSPESMALASARGQQLDLDKFNVADDAAQHGRAVTLQSDPAPIERSSAATPEE